MWYGRKNNLNPLLAFFIIKTFAPALKRNAPFSVIGFRKFVFWRLIISVNPTKSSSNFGWNIREYVKKFTSFSIRSVNRWCNSPKFGLFKNMLRAQNCFKASDFPILRSPAAGPPRNDKNDDVIISPIVIIILEIKNGSVAHVKRVLMVESSNTFLEKNNELSGFFDQY